MNFLFLRGGRPADSVLRRVDFKTRDAFIDMGAGREGLAVQAVNFAHPRWGNHAVYVDKATLDSAGIPPPHIYEAIGILLQRAVA